MQVCSVSAKAGAREGDDAQQKRAGVWTHRVVQALRPLGLLCKVLQAVRDLLEDVGNVLVAELEPQLVVLADVGGNHFADLALLQQQTEAKIVDPRVVGDAGHPADAAAYEFCNAVFRNAAQAKPAQHQGHVVGHPVEGGLGSGDHFGNRHGSMSLIQKWIS